MVFGIFCNADGNRLNLGNFDENGLNCDNWNWDDNHNDNLGVFALMMEGKLKRSITGVFIFSTFYPFAQHTPGCNKLARKLAIFIRIQCFCLPKQCNKKFQLIDFFC